MRDAGQKDLLYRHFRAQGWFAMVEVPITERRGGGEREKLVTDIDVLALRPTQDLGWDVVIGDCKTKKGESPANRALWVRALMDHMRATRGYLLLRREKQQPIERDHKMFAEGHGVTLLEEDEFAAFDRALLYPAGSSRTPFETAATLRSFYEDVGGRFPRLAPLLRSLTHTAWMEPDPFALMRRLVGVVGGIHAEVDPTHHLHVGIILEASAVFGVALAAGVGRIFHQFLGENDRSTLEDGLRAVVWGGRERYEGMKSLRAFMLKSQGGSGPDLRAALGDAEEDFGLPNWGTFMQLVRSGMEAPRLMFRIPHMLRVIAMEEAQVLPRLPRPWNPMVLKLAVLTAEYVSVAAKLPKDMTSRLVAALSDRAAEATRRGVPARDASQGDVGQVSLPLDEPTGR